MENLSELDYDFLNECTRERFKREFKLYQASKTDDLKEVPEIKIQMGADGVSQEVFEKTLEHQVDFIIKRLHRGNFYFYPFREQIKSKDPKIKSPYKALKLGKERILSIASIRDVLVQKVLYDFLYHLAEEKFNTLPLVSFGYRKNQSAPKAAKKVHEHILDGYTFALDGDIKKFFDNIPHCKLAAQLKCFLGDSTLVYQLLYRFIHVDRIEWLSYKNSTYKFFKNKPNRKRRKAGIPQGGILSGLIANIYLHQFDKWILEQLGKEYPLRYIRYADDFIILTKDSSFLEPIKEKCSIFLENLGLELHTDPEKTRLLDLTKKGSFINFVGFSISETGIRIKPKNIKRFKERIRNILQKTNLDNKNALKILKLKLDYKFMGNELKHRVCKNCGKQEVRRNWLSFFLTVHDIQQLRAIDHWCRKEINKKYYLDTKQRLPRNTFIKLDFPSLEKLYYQYRKSNKDVESICICSPLDSKFITTRDPYEELFKY